MEGRNQFTFYRSFYEAVVKLPKTRQLPLLLAIVRYGLDKTEPEGLNGQQEAIFRVIQPVLNTAWRKSKLGVVGGKNGKRGPAEKISKGEIEIDTEINTEIDTEINTESEGEGEGFPLFWARYPVKIGKAAAEAAWESVCEKYSQKRIFSALRTWLDSNEWKRENGRYVPKPAKWLEEAWFLQSPMAPVPCGVSGQLGEAELEAIAQLLQKD